MGAGRGPLGNAHTTAFFPDVTFYVDELMLVIVMASNSNMLVTANKFSRLTTMILRIVTI